MRWRDKKKDYGQSIISAGVALDGRLRFKGAFRVDGQVRGEIVSPGTLVVEESAVIRGDICVGHLELGGTVHGNIKVTQEINLHVTAKVYGDISYTKLSIEVGALHEGSSHKLTEEELAALKEIQDFNLDETNSAPESPADGAKSAPESGVGGSAKTDAAESIGPLAPLVV